MDTELLFQEFSILRKILLSILFHNIDSNASDDYIRKQLSIAGATEEEIKEFLP